MCTIILLSVLVSSINIARVQYCNSCLDIGKIEPTYQYLTMVHWIAMPLPKFTVWMCNNWYIATSDTSLSRTSADTVYANCGHYFECKISSRSWTNKWSVMYWVSHSLILANPTSQVIQATVIVLFAATSLYS